MVYCRDNCGFPPCDKPGCSEPRPRTHVEYRFDQMKTWKCAAHADLACHKCGKPCSQHRGIQGDFVYCSDECRYPPCAEPGCKEPRPQANAHFRFDQMETWKCAAHVGSTCHNCGKRCERHANDHRSPFTYCDDTCRSPPCAHRGCTTRRPEGNKYTYDKIATWKCKKHK